MTARPNALRIGLFALLGVFLLAAAIVAIVGVQIFKTGDRVVMNFPGSVYGLKVGAPVVFRGVELGGVRAVGVARVGGHARVPVVAELDRAKLQAIAGVASNDGAALASLLRQGLSAQLATQSLLTGQLYVDLDLRPGANPPPTAVAAAAAVGSGDGALVEIPTSLTRFQSLQEQLDKMDVQRMSQDLSATLAAARALVAGPELKQALDGLAQASAALARVSTSMDQRLPALVNTARGALQMAGQASQRVGTAAERVAGVVDQAGVSLDKTLTGVGAAANRAETLLSPGSPLHTSVQSAADELGRSAAELRGALGDQGTTVLGLQRALADVSRAARAVRELADQIEQQPQSLIRGREPTP